jgi:glycosyltransferase involved in cell wall biosynthesis
MPSLLERHPGIVVLHDFFLGDLLNDLDHSNPAQHIFSRALHESHGHDAILHERRAGRMESIRKYPCNKAVLEQAQGIIVHSRYSMQLAASWYGMDAEKSWRHIPILKPVPEKIDREAARRQLGIAHDDFVMLSFGFLVPFKLNDRLIDAWLDSPLAADRQCHLVFVGESNVPVYADALKEKIERSHCSARIRITGFVDQQTYHAYLAAADSAVQLRSQSRGETSAAILDCLAYGIPTIINAHGSAAELPDHVSIKLPDIFTQAALCDALCRLRKDAGLRKSLSERAVHHVCRYHAPENICKMYRDAIEEFRSGSSQTGMPVDSGNRTSTCRL